MTSRENQLEQWDVSETPNESIPQISQELHKHGCRFDSATYVPKINYNIVHNHHVVLFEERHHNALKV